MARLIHPKHGTGPQNDGERRAVEFLLTHLPPKPKVQSWQGFGQQGAEYVVIPNFELPKGRGDFFEIDILLIAPHAIYVIEVKDWGLVLKGMIIDGILTADSNGPIRTAAPMQRPDVSRVS